MKKSAEEFIGKIRSEGGIIAALDYGLTTPDYDLPGNIAAVWYKLADKYSELYEFINDFLDTVEDAGLDLDE